MAEFWTADDEDGEEVGTDRSVRSGNSPGRKQQITIRLDPGMITDARQIAARKGIGHHTLLRMWVMEGITRAYQEGVLEGPPRSWSQTARRGAEAPPAPEPDTATRQPGGKAPWNRLRPRRGE